jgi:hypothetical protein
MFLIAFIDWRYYLITWSLITLLKKFGIESYNNDLHHLVTDLYQERYDKEVIRLKAMNSIQLHNNFIKFYISSKPCLRLEMIADIYVSNNFNITFLYFIYTRTLFLYNQRNYYNFYKIKIII